MTQTIRLMGIDPALRNTGVAILDYDLTTGATSLVHIELIETEARAKKLEIRKTADELRCVKEIGTALRRILAKYNPSMAASEVSVFSQHARGMLANGIAIGILGMLPIPVIEVSNIEVKQAAGGTKTSSKEFMVQWAVGQWPEAPWLARKYKGEVEILAKNEHIADACAAAVAGTMTAQFSQAVALLTAMRSAA